MFKQLAPSVIEELKTDGRIILTVKPGWEKATELHAIPYKINICIETQMEHIFNCYLYLDVKTVMISDIEPSSLIADKKSLVDSYIGLAIDGIIKFAKMQKKSTIIIDSHIQCIADHLPDYGFKIMNIRDFTKSIKGVLTLR